MKQDEQGWGGRHGAPAAKHWHCPECDFNSAVEDWGPGDSAEGDSRHCPHCGFLFAVAAAGRISEANFVGHCKRDPDGRLQEYVAATVEHRKAEEIHKLSQTPESKALVDLHVQTVERMKARLKCPHCEQTYY